MWKLIQLVCFYQDIEYNTLSICRHEFIPDEPVVIVSIMTIDIVDSNVLDRKCHMLKNVRLDVGISSGYDRTFPFISDNIFSMHGANAVAKMMTLMTPTIILQPRVTGAGKHRRNRLITPRIRKILVSVLKRNFHTQTEHVYMFHVLLLRWLVPLVQFSEKL